MLFMTRIRTRGSESIVPSLRANSHVKSENCIMPQNQSSNTCHSSKYKNYMMK